MDNYVRIKVTKEARQMLKVLAAETEQTMIDAATAAFEHELDRSRRGDPERLLTNLVAETPLSMMICQYCGHRNGHGDDCPYLAAVRYLEK